MSYIISCCSTADLSKEHFESRDIHYVCFHYAIDGVEYPGVTNIGVKPTVTDEKKVGVETHLFDFDEDVYGKYAITQLLRFIRPEMRFANLDDMLTRIREDCIIAKKCF